MAKEDTLIYRAQTGDEGAFADLMRVYHAFVYVIVTGIVDNSHDAEEVVQDAFLNAYQGLKQLEDATKFKSWLAEITRNCARQWLRKQRGETVSIDEVSEHLLQTEDSPDEQLVRQEQRELIRRTMETLPQKDRDIARAFYLEGASYDELTSTHGLSYNAIAFRLSRAKRQLSKRLQYLLTGIFVSPATILKKLYSGGLTAMKVGTVPKIVVGIAALIVVIFIGFVGVREIRAPKVEERVYLSPWEDGTPRPHNSPEGLAAQADSTQDTDSEDTQSQIATAASAAGMEPIDEFFGQSEETDMAQFATEAEFQLDADQNLSTDTSTLLDNKGQSAEDVMYAYVKALKNLNIDAMHALATKGLRGRSEKSRAKLWVKLRALSANMPGMEQMMEELNNPSQRTKQMVGETMEIVSSEYVGDEFHFRLRFHLPEMPEVPGLDLPEVPKMPDTLHKIRQENGVWLVYE